ncbi:hypothetical protein DCC39_17690 [Pueribacillus theae]|uniref:ABC transporter substrate-binding protein n=1 Tax=Pueribacillus theae TaxID=2171751 RepID=A0A2U1JLL6_9BACI|nr:extracellular solute-binding protein [Pueribacillus theae]PWA06061.1 hypothetical protein DCC39_17690 [Pueribacillus theae]
MVSLKGMTWDHERGVSPLKAASIEFHRSHPNIDISWDARPLKDFEDYPVELLAERYDLILLDHPFIGTGVYKKVIEPLDKWLSMEYLEDQKKNSVGKSYESYEWNGHQWALAVDAAAQVSAYRNDLLEKLGMVLPETWDDMFRFIHSLPEGYKVGLPLNPTHAYCSFITLCAGLGGEHFWNESIGINSEAGEKALTLLKELAPVIYKKSFEMDPIQMLNLMAEDDEVIYAPLIFGYSNYAQPGYAPNVLSFKNIPANNGEPKGSILGGVGIALSSYSQHKQEAINFVKYVSSEKCQRGLFFENGGQPGYRTAWMDDKINANSNNFFKETLRTLDLAYMRPRYYGYNTFQKNAGKLINQFLSSDDRDIKAVLQILNDMYRNSKIPN